MKYRLADPQEAAKARAELERLIERGTMIDLSKARQRRSLSQNAYLHLLLGAFGYHFGYTLEEAKLIYKELNASLYKYEKKGRTFWRSSTELSKEQMAKSIDIFREKSAQAGYDLPLATDQEWLQELENVIEQSKYWLE